MSTAVQQESLPLGREIRKEIVRKGLHLMIGVLPWIAWYSYTLAYILLIAGSLIYTVAEITRLIWNGSRHFLPYSIIRATSLYVSRPGEANGFIIAPLTLAAGAGITLLIYPRAAMLSGILALAIGDTSAALAGKFLGRQNHGRKSGKSAAGTGACYVSSLICIWIVTGSFTVSLAGAAMAAFSEYITPREFDNLVVPISTGAVVFFMM
ncbi:MAG: hypothetical protein K9L21_04310 [Spirochaetia bacterium]|nr:hypothetical protein [Spirochaetia bacterium]